MQTPRLLKLPDFPFKEYFLKFYRETGVDFYFVGGFVRDILLGRGVNDIDIVPVKIGYVDCAEMLNRYIRGSFVHFKDNVRITKGGFTIDISRLRGETIDDDLKKRDFTINNLAYHFGKGLVGDPTDLNNKTIRAVSDESFVDDPLRVLRGYRFASQFGFTIEPHTGELMKSYAPLLAGIPAERINKELNETLLGEYFLNILDTMIKDDIFLIIFPIFKTIKDLYGGVYHIEDVLSHTFSLVRIIYPMVKEYGEMDRLILILAALLHDIGKGDERFKTTPGKFVGHEEISAKLTIEVLKKLTYPAKIVKEVSTLVKKHGIIRKYATNGAGEITLLRFIFENYNILDKLMILSVADALSKNRCDICFHNTIERIRSLIPRIDLSRKELINGNDIINMGVEKGPLLGKILDDLHFRLCAGIIKDRGELDNYLRMKMKEIGVS
ncbi:CCA tRNA nucleotidyltransferase [Calditerrivibrio sp.]|uniref:CCA tRNA nucleotidyltransferase n=1 Tax=Calditerrivibrio sp. TaxID=2792612 RepID=UPI003D119F30